MRFSYDKSIAQLMWVFVALASIELVVIHLLVSAWRGDVALVLSVATLAVMGWLVRAIWSFKRLPVELDDRTLRMRVGTIKAIAIAIDDIAAIRAEAPPGTAKRGVLNLALIAHPNIYVELTAPQPVGRRSIEVVAHRLDDSAAFTSAINRLVAPT